VSGTYAFAERHIGVIPCGLVLATVAGGSIVPSSL
jgi:hypothetical protein